jgi:two-component system, OmpR family, response regulator
MLTEGGKPAIRCAILANYGAATPASMRIGIILVMKKNIAIVEDEPALRENYAAALSRHGYQVKTYGNRQVAMQAFKVRLPDLAIIDISLEDEAEGGFDLCRDLRAMSDELPIIFLTARDSELDAVSGLRLGADDFLTKDVSLAHLAARVAALFRRIDAVKRPDNAAQIIRRGALSIDGEKMQATWNAVPVTLSLTEFWIVHALARNPGHVKNRQQLMDAANVMLDDNTITSHVKRLRRKFQQVDPAFDAIETVYGMGYRWVE